MESIYFYVALEFLEFPVVLVWVLDVRESTGNTEWESPPPSVAKVHANRLTNGGPSLEAVHLLKLLRYGSLPRILSSPVGGVAVNSFSCSLIFDFSALLNNFNLYTSLNEP
mmetsp:Transcript_67084/g.135222  ORF Transcript_67084/g.135222 Transcript_67084/m.135222 type:complete len:111 (+) Transcript_67084:129-461(+)